MRVRKRCEYKFPCLSYIFSGYSRDVGSAVYISILFIAGQKMIKESDINYITKRIENKSLLLLT